MHSFSQTVCIQGYVLVFRRHCAVAMSAPNQKERQQCWAARDEYWKCLDGHSGDRTKCQNVRKKFEESCSKSWVIISICLKKKIVSLFIRDSSHSGSNPYGFCLSLFLLFSQNCDPCFAKTTDVRLMKF